MEGCMSDQYKKHLILPCPFCGNTNIYIDGYDHAAGIRWRLVCLKCMATVDPGTIQQKYIAIEAWNRRTPDGHNQNTGPV